MKNVVAIIEANAQGRPSAAEFEIAYQVRVAMGRMKFAMTHTEQFAPRTDAKEVGLQLFDSLERLESGGSPVLITVAVWTEPVVLGGDAKWERQRDRGVVVTRKGTFAHSEGRC